MPSFPILIWAASVYSIALAALYSRLIGLYHRNGKPVNLVRRVTRPAC